MKKTMIQIEAYIAKHGNQFTKNVRYAKHDGALIVAFFTDMRGVPEQLTADIMAIGRKNGVTVRPCGDFFGHGVKWL